MAGGLDRQRGGLGRQGAHRAPAGGRRPRPAALPRPRRQAGGDAGAAEPGGQARRLSGADPRHRRHRRLFQQLVQLALGQRIAAAHPVLRARRPPGVGSVASPWPGPASPPPKDYPIQTRLGWGAITRSITELQQPGETYTPPAGAGRAASPPARRRLQVQVSYSPFQGFDPGPIAVSLCSYPYGCTEQLVSTAYPAALRRRVRTDPKLWRASRALNDAVGQLLDRQSLDGAFGLWRVGDGEADAWLGAYATDFLMEARATARRCRTRPSTGRSAPCAPISPARTATPSVVLRAVLSRLVGRPAATPPRRPRRGCASQRLGLRPLRLAKGGRGDLARLRWWHDVQMKIGGLAAGHGPGGRGAGADGRPGPRPRRHGHAVRRCGLQAPAAAARSAALRR